jgi:hypothetical protein
VRLAKSLVAVHRSSVRSPPSAFVLVVLLAGCTSSVVGEGTVDRVGGIAPNDDTTRSETATLYDSLFEAPANATASDGLVGLWAGSTHGNDVRLQLSASKIIVAMRCEGQSAVGIEIGAVVSAGSLRILESKTLGDEYDACNLTVRPTTIPRCESQFDTECFVLEGTTLTFEFVSVFTSQGFPAREFTKLSD